MIDTFLIPAGIYIQNKLTSNFLPILVIKHAVYHAMGSEDVVAAHVVLKTTGVTSRSIPATVAVVAERKWLVERQPDLHFVSEVVKEDLQRNGIRILD